MELENSALPVDVLLVDDHTLVRQGFKLLLGQEAAIRVVGEAANGLQALEQVELLRPHVVLMDLVMPVMDGVTAIREIRQKHPGVEVIALTSVLEDASVLAAVRNGAIGYLMKDMQALDLCRCIRAAAAGQVQLAPEAAARLVRELRPLPENPVLTRREREVLRLVADGLSNSQIAQRLVIGHSTVKKHLGQLLAKLKMQSRTQLAVHVWQQGVRW